MGGPDVEALVLHKPLSLAREKEEGRVPFLRSDASNTMSWLTSFTEMLGMDNGAAEGTAFEELAPVHARKVSR